jgi:hypothetical protein
MHLLAPPDMPMTQLAAIEAIERTAYAYRQSYAGQDYARRRAAAKKGKK